MLKWNNDPDVLYFSESDDIHSYTMEAVQEIYSGVSQKGGICFIIEASGEPIGECWLQRMNLDRFHQKYPDVDCRRIDLMIGEKAFWGRGLGTEVIGLLTDFAFEVEQADLVFGCEIADYNPASLRAFQKNGYQIENQIIQPPDNKAQVRYDMVKTNPMKYNKDSGTLEVKR